ncbi:START-2 domain protein [Senna tora]|uniref:START-2 domain protein n=1 Tax=Senna tora TaxID=362788 RepID=A0A834W0I2_9FABA|nr:START-2 domain protein [Senna tora]
MEKKQKIVQYRERLYNTLCSPDLTNEEILKTLVKSQLLNSSEHETKEYKEKVVESRTAEVSKFLDMLRSASVDDSKSSNTSHGDWKLKQDTEEFRVMYREGPEGTPFHTLLVEGYVDGPLDVCLCISWETTLYKKWWPQSTVPTFKIVQSDCLQKIQIAEQISLVRVKVSWPLSTREAVMHCYLFEYFQDDLIVGLINTVPESKSINGFKNEEIPEAKDAVRIDMMGGFALQKVDSERSYFRTIANMDIKLDFVPPSLINFISRQLIGSGFRLYQKTVASMKRHDKEFKEFSKALGDDPLYARIREALYDTVEAENTMDDEQELKQSVTILEAKTVSLEDTINQYADKSMPTNAIGSDNTKPISEIEELDGEEEEEETVHMEEEEEDAMEVNDIPMEQVKTRSLLKDKKRNVNISSEVEEALDTLEKAISMVRKYRLRCDAVDSYSPKRTQPSSQEAPEAETISDIHNLRKTGTNVISKEVNYNKVVPASPKKNLSRPIEANQVALCSLENGAADIPSIVNGIQDIASDRSKTRRKGKYKYCCFLPQLKRKS